MSRLSNTSEQNEARRKLDDAMADLRDEISTACDAVEAGELTPDEWAERISDAIEKVSARTIGCWRIYGQAPS